VKTRKLSAEHIIPFAGLVCLILLFTILTGDKFWRPYNLRSILNQTVLYMFGGLGLIFVIAQGSIDLSQGAVLALTAAISAILVNKYGLWLIFPSSIILGALLGLLNGLIISKLKVPSVTCTLAFSIAYRGLLPVFTRGGPIYVPFKLFDLYNFENMFPVLVLLTLIFGYLFEYTKIGYYSKAIGENEIKARNSGVPVERIKIIAYVLCGVMAGIAGVFTLSRVGGVDVSMGNFFELEVMLAIFTGGVPVTGGMPTRIYRLFVGALTIGVLVNGLTLYGVSAALAEGLKGLMLIGLVFLTARFTTGRRAATA